jgi:hypothetical protein
VRSLTKDDDRNIRHWLLRRSDLAVRGDADSRC